MVINTKEFQVVSNKILNAVTVAKGTMTDNAGNLELKINGDFLYLSVTNNEFYVSIKFPVSNPEPFCLVVEATPFLTLVSGITAEEFTLNADQGKLTISVGKSKYELPIIMEGMAPMKLPVITVTNPTVEMPISCDVLASILNVNSKEVAKTKPNDTNELRKLYFMDEVGCFTYAKASGCINAFELVKPVKLLLNDRIVKLFKLFTTDVDFKLGYDSLGNRLTTKIAMQADNTYLAAKVTNDDVLLARMEKPYQAMKQLVAFNYTYNVVVNASEVASAISRLLNFARSTTKSLDPAMMPAKITLSGTQLTITDLQDNVECLSIENENTNAEEYSMYICISELKTILESSKVPHVTVSFGNHKSVLLTRGPVSNILMEMQETE